MTHFEPREGTDHFMMFTMVPDSTAEALMTMRDVGDGTVTEQVRLVVSNHKWFTKLRDAGELIVEHADGRLDPIEMPQEDSSGESAAGVIIDVSRWFKEYLEPMCDVDDSTDLMDFWKSAVRFACKLDENQLLGREILQISPGTLAVRKMIWNGPFASDQYEASQADSRWKQWWRKVRGQDKEAG